VRVLFIQHIPQKAWWHHCQPQPTSPIVFRQPLQQQLCIIKPAVQSTSGILTLLAAHSEIIILKPTCNRHQSETTPELDLLAFGHFNWK
jgi:hypothetical protein